MPQWDGGIKMILDVHTRDASWKRLCWCLPAVMVLVSLRAGLIYVKGLDHC